MALEALIRRGRREFGRWLLVENGTRVAAWSAALLTAALVVDSLAPLPLAVRWSLFWAGLAAFGAASHRKLLAPWRTLRPDSVLRRAEGLSPALASRLISAWELRERVAEGTSPGLARAHREQAERLAAGASGLRLYPGGWSAGTRKATLALAAWTVVTAGWLVRASAGPERLLAPWRERPLDEFVAISPGSTRLPWGSDVEIGARWTGARLGPLDLWVKPSGASWIRVPWEPVRSGEFRYRLGALREATEYQLRSRDRRTRRYRLDPLPAPQFVGATLRIYPPGRSVGSFQEVRLEGAGEIAALRGSWIVARGKPNVPLERAAVRVSFLGAPVEMRVGADGSWEGAFPLREAGRFQFELISRDGLADPAPVAYSLRALADEPPRVELLSPAFEVEASPRDRLPIAYHADDDHGLSAVWLVFRVPGPRGAEERMLALSVPSRGSKEVYGDYSWDLSGLPVGARVEFQVRADDNASPKPQSGWSGKGYLRLADLDAAHADAEKRWSGTHEALGKLAEREAEMRRLASEAASDPAAAQRNRSARETLDRQLASDWNSAARSASEMADAMEKDPYANPGVAAELKALADQIKEAATHELPQASEAGRSGDFKRAESLHGALESRARQAAKRLAESGQMQALQDFWNEADRMDQAASDLANALSSMAQGRKPSADEKRRLDEALAKLQREMEALAKAIESMPKPPPDSAQDKARKSYQVPLRDAQGAAEALSRALASGDYAAAARIAKQLSEQLSRVRQSIGDAARAQAGGGSESDDALSKKLEAAEAAWGQVVEQQTQAMSGAQKLEDARTQDLLAAQKGLLERLRQRQADALRRARELGARVPSDAFGWMQATLDEFARGAVERAPDHLRRAASRLRSSETEEGPLASLAKTEEEILQELERGAQPPPSAAQRSQASAAAAAQQDVRRRTEELEKQMTELGREGGGLPARVTEPLSAAQTEQRAAEKSLGDVDSAAGLQHEGKALEHLERGRQALSEAAQRQQQIEGGRRKPFDSPRSRVRMVGKGGQGGGNTGFVPLPSAKDYQPPREMRQEVERSAQERRPAAYDPVIKEYLRRMSE